MVKRVVVTGCAGFMGSHLADALLSAGIETLGVDDLSGGYRDWLPVSRSFTFEKLDLNEHERFRSVMREFQPEAIYHLAAYAAEGLSPFVRRLNYERNLMASMSVINACIETGAKLIFTSSMAIYGSQVPPFTEDMRPEPIDSYGVAKAAVERDIHLAGEQHNMKWSVVRPHNVVGIRQNIWDRYRNVLGIFIRRAIEGESLLVYGDGSQRRAFSDIDSYIDPMMRLSEMGDGEIYNVGSDTDISINDLAQMVHDVAVTYGFSARIEHVEGRHEVSQAYSDHEKARRDLFFADQTDLNTTVRRVFEWALSQPTRPVRKIDYEVDSGVYAYWR